MNFKTFYLDEMAKPKEEHFRNWYHGTNKDGFEGIKSDGYLIPSNKVGKTTKSMMAPQHNKVYLTNDVDEAIGYAFFRSKPEDIVSYGGPKEKFGYLVIVDGNDLNDIDPDEDIIADTIPKYIDSSKNYWLRDLAMKKAPKSLERYDRYGDYAYGTALGKILIKYLSDEQKYKLIEYGKKIAHTGMIQPTQIWKLSHNKYLKQDIVDKVNYKKFGELVWEKK